MSDIKLLITDDHDMVRKGLIVLLENFDNITVVGEARDGQAAFDFCRQTPPDVVLMDLVMPVMDGITATQLIRGACPTTQVIALTSFGDEDNVNRALKAGAIGFLMKNISGDELVAAIRNAAAGHPTLSSEAAQVLIQAAVKPPQIGHDLTEREREVLALMVEGLNNREIGQRLFVSASTIKNHVSNIFGKLGITSRTQAVVMAVEHKLIDIRDGADN